MRIVFFGNADFGCKTLEALCSNDNHQVVAVVTNCDKKSGRNLKLLPSPIKIQLIEVCEVNLAASTMSSNP